MSVAVLVPLLLAARPARAADEHEVIDTTHLTTIPTADTAKPPPSPDDAPPLPPHKHGVLVESSLGALGFLGQFRHVAPPAPWLKLHAGYELWDFLAVFAEGDMFFTDTSVAQDPPKTQAFVSYGFGGGVRGTLHATERFAVYLEPSVGLAKADIEKHGLANIGYKDAENLNLYFAGHLGLEWYQLDRHLALGLLGGVRDLTGFKKQIGPSDLPLAWDTAVSIRYAF